MVSVTLDSSVETYVRDSATQGDIYSVPISFGVNKCALVDNPATKWADTEEEVKAELLAFTQSPMNHEIVSHTISHPFLSDTNAFNATYVGAGVGTIVVSGTYPSLIVNVTSNGSTVATLDTTITDYGHSNYDLATIQGIRYTILTLTDWSASIGTGGRAGALSRSLKNGTYVVTTNTSIPFDIDTDYRFWKSEITGMTEWIESFMGNNYIKSFIIPFASRDGTTYTDAWFSWMNDNIATTHVGGARTMSPTEQTNPISTLIPNNLSQIMGIGTVPMSRIVCPDSATATEEDIRNNARAFSVWVAETGALGVIAVHESECTAVQLGYILEEISNAQDITVRTFWGMVNHIRTSGLWTDEGNGTWSRTFTDNSNYNLQYNSPAIDSGTDVGLTTDFLGNPIYGTPDIGAYEYQPPYNISTDSINTSISKNIRIYGDGKFRYLNSSTASINANLSVKPVGEFNSTNYSSWMDINVTTWTSSLMNWTESSGTIGNTNVTQAICGLTSGNQYNIYYTKSATRTLLERYTVGSDGCVNFNYTEGYSTVTFDMGLYTAPTTPTETPTSSSGGGVPTYYPTQSNLQEGYEKSLRKSWKLKFEIKNETHHLKLDDIKDETATLTISSEPITFDLNINETKKLDLDSDGSYDLEVLLKDVRGIYADLVVKLIDEEIFVEEEPVTGNVVDDVERKDIIIKEKSYLWVWFVVGFVVLVLVGVDYLLFRKKKS